MDSIQLNEMVKALRAAISKRYPAAKAGNMPPTSGTPDELLWILYNVSVGNYGNPALWLGLVIARAEVMNVITGSEVEKLMVGSFAGNVLSVELRGKLGWAGENVEQFRCFMSEEEMRISLKKPTEGGGVVVVLEEFQEIIEFLQLAMYWCAAHSSIRPRAGGS